MATYELQGQDVEFLVRVADTGEFKEMVCDADFSFDISNDVSTTKTKRCGTFKGVLAPDFKANGTAVHNTEPTATEVSYDQVATWQINTTKIEWIIRNQAYGSYAAGEALRFTGYGYFVSSQATFGNDVVKFTWNMEGVGILNDTES
jgi:hypothetical protein